jgi:hypothetical protein
MDATEIQGLLEEVDGFDEAGESTPADGAAWAGQAAPAESLEVPETIAQAGDSASVNEDDLFATPPVDAQVVEEGHGNGSVWMGAPEGERQELVAGESANLEAHLSADAAISSGEENLSDGEENLAAVEEPILTAESPSAELPLEHQVTGENVEPTGESPLSFESFMDQDPVEPSLLPEQPGTNGDAPVAEEQAPVAEMLPMVEASDHPTLVPGVAEQDDNGDLRVPLRLQLNGHEHTYILTLSLEPQREDPS